VIRERAPLRRGNKDVDVLEWDEREESINGGGQ